MLVIIPNQIDPYHNLASEEYLLKIFRDDIIILYRNSPSIIIGKHQNAFAEFNFPFFRDHQIPVIRRLSGGGAVYHDEGNLNFSFICNSVEGKQIDFKRFTVPIIKYLQQMGVPVVQNERSDLLINGMKCSGNAEHIYKNRTLHHGTLLFSTDLKMLRAALQENSYTITDKAVKSQRSHVTNISDYLTDPIPFETFRNNMARHIMKFYPDSSLFTLSASDTQKIDKLADEKYQTWEWNFAYSPRCSIHKMKEIGRNSYQMKLEVEKGCIIQASITENGVTLPDLSKLLVGIPYKEESVVKIVPDLPVTPHDLKTLLFN